MSFTSSNSRGNETMGEDDLQGGDTPSSDSQNGGDNSPRGSSSVSSSTSNSSSASRNFRLLSEIYDEIEEVEAENELLLLGVNEPTCYSEAITEPAWEQAMKDEVDAIERNNTWDLVELPAGCYPAN